MSRKPTLPLFLQQSTYRQRRLRDAIKLLPLLAVVLWMVPLAWPQVGGAERLGSEGLIYLFGVWICIIAIGAILTRRLRERDAPDWPDDGNT